MSFQVELRSKEAFLGDLVRALSVYTDVNDVSSGSNTATLLEAVATALFQISLSSLKILQSTNLEALRGQQLDKKAESIKIPNGVGGSGRKPSTQSSGPVVVGSGFEKISSKLYAGKPAPFAGSDKLYVEDASSFPASGLIYIGRGTVDRFEGPLPYSSVTNNGSFWTINLSALLTKSHLSSDLVVLSQGGDRLVPAGTTVQVPSSDQSPAVSFTTTQDLLIPDGEAEGTVNVVCTQFGEVGNVLSNAISQFTSSPFSGATVRNSSNFSNGKSTESDESLRLRIKNYPATLSRGTKAAILSAIIGATDSETGRTIQSAKILDPVEAGDIARGYIDDSTGLEPTFDNQSYELLLDEAAGQERKFTTAKSPITAAVADGSEFAPYVISSEFSLTVEVDGVIETYTVTPSNYQNLNAATAYEIVRDLNFQSNLVGFRTLEGGKRIAMIDLSGTAEEIKVHPSDFQEVLGFSTSVIRPIFVYKNSKLQSFRGKTATLEMRPRNQWSVTVSDLENVRFAVDGVVVEFSITDSDFAQYGTSISSATVAQWADVFSKKIAGVKFTTSGQVIVWSSRNTFSPDGTLEVLELKADGSAAGWIGDSKMWKPATSGGKLYDEGAEKDYSFNRFTGEIAFASKLTAGDRIEIASRDTRAHVVSSVASTGQFGFSPILTTVGNSRIVVGFDGEFLIRDVVVPSGAQFTPTIPDPAGASNVLRLTANTNEMFANAEVGDWIYLVKDQSYVPAWAAGVEGFYKIKAAGFQKHDQNQNYAGLLASSYTLANAIANVYKDRSKVTITATDHGLKTGDLVTVSTVLAIGGISAVNLSVTDVAVIVIDENTFEYQALASATSDASGIIDSIGTNIITITHSAHGFESGALVDVSVTTGFAGISNTDLSVSGVEIEVVNTNSYKYRAAAAATSSAGGTITTLTYSADCWLEVELSSPQLTAWTPLFSAAQDVSPEMIYIFRSTVTPQLVDFGNVSALTVDQIVDLINDSISGGSALKISPQQFEIRSNDFTSGTCAVLAVVGNAENALSAQVSESLQYHVGYSQSDNTQSGFVVVDSIETPTDQASGYPTRTYLNVDAKFVDVLDYSANPAIESPTSLTPSYPEGFQHTWLTGRFSGLSGRVYNNQTTAPYTGIMRGERMIHPLNEGDTEQTSPDTLDRYANFGVRFRDVNINNNDRFVVEMDLDPTDKTVAIQMSKIAKILDIDAITGSGKGQVISFRLKDPEDGDKAFFDNTSVYKNFDFTDFKLLTKSVGLYKHDLSGRAIVLRSAAFGAPHKLTFSIRYPELPDVADIQVSHSNKYADGVGYMDIVASLPSGASIVGSVYSSGAYKLSTTLVGSLYEVRLTAGSINSGNEYQPDNVINIYGSSSFSGSYKITAATYLAAAAVTADVTNLSNVVTVTYPAHGLQNGDLISVNTSADIGGITAGNLSQIDTPITYIDANTFSYVAGAAATSTITGALDNVTSGSITFIAPGNAGISSSLYSAAAAPVRSWETPDTTLSDMADAINNYYPDFPVATAEAIGISIPLFPIINATYITYPQVSAYVGSSMSSAFDYHTFSCKFSGEAGIWQYDSSNASLNNIKATVQSDDSIFPTAAEALGTSYSPIDEEVYLVPTNSKTVRDWLDFNAASSLNILANIERIQSDDKIQISSKEDGSSGAVKVTGVTANSIESFLEENSTESNDSIKVTILSADSKAINRNSAVLVKNSIATEIQRPYRTNPTGASITSANTEEINTFFRSSNSIKYVRLNSSTGRLIFIRNGKGDAQTEPLAAGNEITFTNLGSGLVQVTGDQAGGPANTGDLSARVGDMMYIRYDSSSPFTVDQRCKTVPSSGQTDGTNPEYVGYPVVHVIDDNNIVIIAPNITNFSTITLAGATADTDLVFLPAIWNEKNIKTNHSAGAAFDEFENGGECHYLVKKLGSGLVSVWLQNSSAESTDTMLLDEMSVSTDDFAVLGSQFDPSNQGTFRVVAHNGRNHIIVYNPNGGKDELINSTDTENGGKGSRKWRAKTISGGSERPIRILAGESVRIGDKLRISTPESSATQWFNSAFFGSWTVTKIGLSAFSFTGGLPHSYSNGNFDLGEIAPYVDFEIPNAPVGITDSNGALVDKFLIALNSKAIGFVEASPYESIRMVAGSAVSPQNPELGELFLVPSIGASKMSNTFGTSVSPLGKLSYEERSFQGIDGYKIYTGLVRESHRIVDGLPSNTFLFPGVKAAGTFIEWLTPLIKTINLSLLVRPKDGVTLNSITDLVKSTAASYINNLGVGSPVVLSEIIKEIQSLPGVFSVQILGTFPAADDDRIVVSESEKAYVINASEDITLG